MEAPQRRRGPLALGLNGCFAVASVALWIGVYLLGDRTNWSDGFGYDGRFYGQLAMNFPSALFGHGAIIPPGVGPYTGPHLSGVDSYYAYRWFPSAIVWLCLEVLRLSHTHQNVVTLFAVLDASMYALATWCWCRIADLLGLGTRAKLVGVIALVISFALKSGTYYPVATDHVALGLGALTMYLWMRGATIPLLVCIVAGSFTFPPHLVIGPLLLLFPYPEAAPHRLADTWTNPETPPARPEPYALTIAAVLAITVTAVVSYIQLSGYQSREGSSQLPLFPLSVLVVGAYAFYIVAYLLPAGGRHELSAVIRAVRPQRIILAGAVIGGVLLAASLLSRRPGYSTVALLKDAIWSNTLDPALFLVVLIGYFGPIFAVLLGTLPRVAPQLWILGPGMVSVVAIGLLGMMEDQPRQVTDALPFLLVAAVLGARSTFRLTDALIGSFLAASVFMSRIWLHVGPISVTNLDQFPAQLYYMAPGLWTTPMTYIIQLSVFSVVLLTLWGLARGSRIRGGHRCRP
jgi:hypothetical protein